MMNSNTEYEANYRDLYHHIKKKYSELRNIRIESVKKDAEDLILKITEHQKVHNISIEELKKQNQELRESIQEIKNAKHQIMLMEKAIRKQREEIRKYDLIVRECLKYPMLYIKCIGYHKYQITYDKKDPLVFTLAIINDNHRYHYEPITFPTVSNPLRIYSKLRNPFDMYDLEKEFFDKYFNLRVVNKNI
ncbi:hypothetical protein TRFO_23866 [Tritrichomonas foetus]|uniref:Kinetochore protein SPC25 n=1 Tax=Tritrichomonas foetus TaxID=1144522 RepID=A0A1J4KA86_9EUKA|nr:hypothetical protein TRFO_23866 [Tritrichomonas foetus]|eukprot:OHT07824.1 hypothetical protein TRFO_23866 [Tritrichomonas foetus]